MPDGQHLSVMVDQNPDTNFFDLPLTPIDAQDFVTDTDDQTGERVRQPSVQRKSVF